MIVLDLFSGLEGWSQAAKDRGHKVVTVDFEERFSPTICADILTVSAEDILKYGRPDVVLASPPCNCFSLMSVYVHWKGNKPDEKAQRAITVLKHTLDLIDELKPKFWVVENPVGMMRTLPFMRVLHHRVVTQCQYGESRMKPTDLWGKFPSGFSARRCSNGDGCHVSAPRGSKTPGSTQGGGSPEERAKIPYSLGLEFIMACEGIAPQIMVSHVMLGDK
jgi:hypothetical protein